MTEEIGNEVSTEKEESAPETGAEASAVDTVDEKEKESDQKPDSGSEGGEAEPLAAKPAYVPNTKIKVYQKEYDIPESFRSLMKDAASEKEVTELFRKAYGLDGLLPKYQEISESFKKTNQDYGQLKGEIGKLSKFVQLKDYDSFFNALQIPEEALRDWMYEKLKRAQLPADQKAVYDREQALRREYYNQEDQRQKLESDLAARNEQFSEVQTRELQSKISEAMSQPDIAHLAKEVDARKGENAFLKEVIKIGSDKYDQTGEITPPEQIVAELAEMYGKFITSPAASQPANRGMATVAANRNNPVIPNTGSGTSSPVKQKINRISDIKKYVENLSG